MIPKEIFEKVRHIEITTSRLVTDVFAGEYHSVFKGRGMEFDEVREYQIGDDIRTIDWNVTARTGHPHIKKYIEERELTVMILVDASKSCHFASVNTLKNKLAAEIAAVLAFSAIRNSDKVGLMIFTDKIEKFIPPRKGRSHVLRVIREVLYFQPEHQGTDIRQALEYLNKVAKRKAVVFVISDFLESNDDQTDDSVHHKETVHKKGIASFLGAGFKKSLSIANKRHDLVAITLTDPREVDLPNCGLIALEDAETGTAFTLDSSNPQVRAQYHQKAKIYQERRGHLFSESGVDHIDILTDQPYTHAFVKFFKQRRRRLV